MRHRRPGSPLTSTPSRDARPATAPSIASRWSPAASSAPPSEPARALHHEAVGRRLDPRPEAAQPLDDRRDPVGLLATQLLGAVHRRAPLGKRAEQRHQRQLVDRERDLGRLDLGAAQLGRAHHDVAHRLTAGSACSARPPRPPPIRSRTRQQARARRVHPHAPQHDLRARHERRRGDEERRRGEVARDVHLAPARCGACRTP